MLPPTTLLIPGPWTVRGNTVLDANGKTIAVCFARNATAHAYWIAEIPKLTAEMDSLRRENEALKGTVDRLENRLEDLKNEGFDEM